MVIAFIAFWVVVALTVIFVAMRGGARAAGTPAAGESRAANRLLILVVIALFAFGVAIPALVMAANGAHKGAVAPGGVMLNAQEQHGRHLFSQVCSSCHTLAATRSVAQIGPNLDVLIPTTGKTDQQRATFVLSAILQGRARGNGNMPALLFQGVDASAVASFVARAAGH
jgi:mono/diheme cytochrome c family protein